MLNIKPDGAKLFEIKKKFLILNIIDLARNGDDMGSKILTFYHALVDHVL